MTDTEKFKIGVTKTSVDKRIKQLQTGCPEEILLIDVFECEHYRKVEQWLHRRYQDKRLEGEWFQLTELDVMTFQADCILIHDTVKLLLEQNEFFK